MWARKSCIICGGTGVGQDHAAAGHGRRHPAVRAARHHRGLLRAGPRPLPGPAPRRRGAGGPGAEPRRRGRGQPGRAGALGAAHEPRPGHRGRGPRRGGPGPVQRHVPGHRRVDGHAARVESPRARSPSSPPTPSRPPSACPWRRPTSSSPTPCDFVVHLGPRRRVPLRVLGPRGHRRRGADGRLQRDLPARSRRPGRARRADARRDPGRARRRRLRPRPAGAPARAGGNGERPGGPAAELVSASAWCSSSPAGAASRWPARAGSRCARRWSRPTLRIGLGRRCGRGRRGGHGVAGRRRAGRPGRMGRPRACWAAPGATRRPSGASRRSPGGPRCCATPWPAAAGLEQAIIATAPVAPLPIRAEVVTLAVRLEGERLAPALRAFADEVADPTGDLVVAALVLAAEHQAQRLGELLGSLAAAARDQATMRLRVEAGRARTRTSVKVVVGVTATLRWWAWRCSTVATSPPTTPPPASSSSSWSGRSSPRRSCGCRAWPGRSASERFLTDRAAGRRRGGRAVTLALVCGAGVGLGLLLVVRGLFPPRPSLAHALAQLRRLPEPAPVLDPRGRRGTWPPAWAGPSPAT